MSTQVRSRNSISSEDGVAAAAPTNSMTASAADDTATISSSMSDTTTTEDFPSRPAPAHKRPHRTSVLQWVPSDPQQLANTEACMLHVIKRRYLQRHIAGLNTISSVIRRPAAGSGPAQPAPPVQRHIVLLHGFGGGMAMWAPNFDALVEQAAAQRQTIQVHAIDMPGFARSDRHPKVSFDNDREAMDYMCGHIREWFKTVGLDRAPRGATTLPHVDIVGHSFGAYTAATFASRYPHLVNRVVLCDPWGVAEKPVDIDDKLGFRRRMLMRTFYAGNPFSALRGAGPFGPGLLPSVRKDFADRWEPIVGDANIFFDYVYHCNASGHPTGEQAFQACCTGPVFARRPLCTFVPSLPDTVDLAVVYGSHTWMDKEAGRSVVEEARSRRPQAQNDVEFVDNAGHQVNTDNVLGFNQQLAAALNFHGCDYY